MTTEQAEEKLQTAYPDADIAVIDLTGGGSNFEVRIASSQFKGQSRLLNHQSVMAVFKEELDSGEVHALAVKTLEK